jgi:hypothetical protein
MVDTGGIDLGPIGQLGSRGGGGLPGLNWAMKTASRTPEWKAVYSQARPGKDFNDSAVPVLAGSHQGGAVYGPPGGGGSWGGLGELGGFAAL